MDISKTSAIGYTGSSYQLEGRTAKNLYKGPSGELADKLDRVYEKENRRNKVFADPEYHIERKYFDPSYCHYRVLDGEPHSAVRMTAYSNEMRVLNGGKPYFYSVMDYAYRGYEAPSIHGEIESFRSSIHDRLNMDFQMSKLFEENNINIPRDVTLTFRSDLYTNRISVLGEVDDSLKQRIESVLNQGKNPEVLSLHIAFSASSLAKSEQYSNEKSSLWNLANKIYRYTGYDMRDLEARDGSFFTKDGEDVIEKVAANVRSEVKGSTPTIQSAALGLLSSRVKYFSENGIYKENAYTDIEFKDGHLLDVRQKYKYGVGQNGWIHDMAKKEGVDDYELTKDGIKLLSKGEPFKVPLGKLAAYQKTNEKDDLPLHRVIRKTLDEFFSKNRFDIPIGTNLSILFKETPHKLLVLGIKNNAVSEMLNESLNKNKELLNLFSQLAKMRFSWKV